MVTAVSKPVSCFYRWSYYSYHRAFRSSLVGKLTHICIKHVLMNRKAVSIVFYRLLLHPYSKYPGPIISRVSGLPVLYHAWKGDFHHYLYCLHYKYGEIMIQITLLKSYLPRYLIAHSDLH